MILKWTNLKRETHVRLACGCEGFIKSIHFERDALLSGFVILYTTNGCHQPKSCEDLYSRGEGPIQYHFNGNLAQEAMPAEEIAIPSWWKQMQLNKTNPELKLP